MPLSPFAFATCLFLFALQEQGAEQPPQGSSELASSIIASLGILLVIWGALEWWLWEGFTKKVIQTVKGLIKKRQEAPPSILAADDPPPARTIDELTLEEKLTFAYTKTPSSLYEHALYNLMPRRLHPKWHEEFLDQNVPELMNRLHFFYEISRDCPFPPSMLGNTIFLFLPALTTFTFKSDSLTYKILPHRDMQANVYRQFLESLKRLSHPVAFELVSEGNTAYFQLTVGPGDQQLVLDNLRIHFPHAVTQEQKTPLAPAKPLYELSLTPKHHHLCLKTLRDFAIDPYSQLFPLIEHTGPDEAMCFQVLFYPASDDFLKAIIGELERLTKLFALDQFAHQSAYTRVLNEIFRADIGHPSNNKYINGIINYLEDFDHTAYTAETAKATIKHLNNKYSPWIVTTKVFSTSPPLLERARSAFFSQYETVDEQWSDRSENGETYQTIHRTLYTWTLSNTDELVALAHFPAKEIQCDKLEVADAKTTAPPPSFTEERGVVIGKNEHRGQTVTVTIPRAVRDRHLYAIGKTRTGKSTLLFNLAIQDIRAGEGVAVIDPHGDLVEDLLDYIPQERIEDCIYFDAAERDHPVAINTLAAQSNEEIGMLADDLIVTFRRLSDSWGDRMETILRYSFHTLLRTEGATFLDTHRLLTNPSFRARVIAGLESPLLLDYWENQFPNLPKDATQPIVSRMSRFMLSPPLTGILGQSESALNFFDIIQNKKIFLANLSQGKIGDDTAKLLGSILVSQLQLAVMRRANLSKEQRDFYFLYVDEFQNFTTSAFDKILSEAGKYKLSLTLAHQYISQLDDKLKHAILGNVGTIIMFAVGPHDATQLRAELGSFTPDDLTNLSSERHEALCRPTTRSADTFKFTTLPPPPAPARSFAREIIEQTREVYGGEVPQETPAVVAPIAPPSIPAAAPAPARVFKNPAPASPQNFGSAKERVLHYVTKAEYLSTKQIIQLCYGHIAESAQAPVASRDLKELVAEKRLKVQPFGRGNVYTTARTCNPTTHNLAIRDLYAKIVRSEFELAEVNFYPALQGINPDLSVAFLTEDMTQIETLWEYDTGTEGVGEILKKVKRYESHLGRFMITFVTPDPVRLAQLMRVIPATGFLFASADTFTTLNDSAFRRSEKETPHPFFFS